MKDYNNLKERCDNEFVISPRGKIVKLYNLVDLDKEYGVGDDERWELWEGEIPPCVVCSVHNEIAVKILRNKGVKVLSCPIDTLCKMGYILYGGIGGSFHSKENSEMTQSQINTMFDLKNKK